VKEGPVIVAGKDLHGQLQPLVKLVVELVHQKQRQLFVVYIGKNRIFQGVGKGAVADVMQQNGQQGRLTFFIRNFCIFVAQGADGAVHQVHGPQSVVKTRMQSPGVNEVRQT
jgi:hypothetical protein